MGIYALKRDAAILALLADQFNQIFLEAEKYLGEDKPEDVVPLVYSVNILAESLRGLYLVKRRLIFYCLRNFKEQAGFLQALRDAKEGLVNEEIAKFLLAGSQRIFCEATEELDEGYYCWMEYAYEDDYFEDEDAVDQDEFDELGEGGGYDVV